VPNAIDVTWEGEGRPLVLVPGALCGPAVWRSTVARYRDRFRVGAIALAGFAGAPPIDAPLVSSARRDLARLLADVGPDAVVVGHSLGAFIAIGAALDARDRVSTVVAVDGVPALGALLARRVGEDGVRDVVERTLPALASLDAARFAAWVAAAFEPLVRDADARAWLVEDAVRSHAPTVAAAMRTLYTEDLRSELRSLRARLVAIVPDHFRASKAQMERHVGWVRETLELAPRLVFARIADASHFPMLDAADAFFRCLDGVIVEGDDVGQPPTM
jgi:pimeloyl-ACP methyl ester carboxylesterase